MKFITWLQLYFYREHVNIICKKDVFNTWGITSFTGENLVQALRMNCSKYFQTETGLVALKCLSMLAEDLSLQKSYVNPLLFSLKVFILNNWMLLLENEWNFQKSKQVGIPLRGF